MKMSFHELSGARDKQDKTDILLDTEMYMQNYSYFVFVCVLQRERERVGVLSENIYFQLPISLCPHIGMRKSHFYS